MTPKNLEENTLENPKHENPESFVEAEEILDNKEQKSSWKEKASENVKSIKDKIINSFSKKQEEEKEPLSEEEMVSRKATQIGFSLEEIEVNEDWKNLSNGQKMLALEQMSQNTLLNVKQMGEERFVQKLKESNFLEKIGKNIRKSYWISKEEKQVLEEVRKGEVKPKQESAEVIIKHLKELDLKTTIDSYSGKSIIEFAKIPENCPKELWKKLYTYNEIANEFSKIPARFGDPTLASKDELKKYREFEYKFKNAQENIIEEENKTEGEFRVLDNRAQEEFKIRALQSKIESPDAFKALDKIENELSWSRLANNENLLKLGYSGAGFVLRTGIKGSVGFAAAPIVGAAIGLWKGVNNGNKKIKEAYIENKSGETRKERMERLKEQTQDLESKLRDEFSKPKDEQNKEFIGSLVAQIEGIKNKDKVDAVIDGEDSIKRLNHLVSKFEKESNEEKRLITYSEVLRRINFIEDRNKKGLINFGDKNSLALKYDLFKKIAEATVVLESGFYTGVTKDGDFNSIIKNHNEHQEKLYDVTTKNEDTFNKKQRKIKNKEIKKAIITGATFATLGAGLRHFYELAGEEGSIVNGGLAKLKEMFGIGDTASVSPENEGYETQTFNSESPTIKTDDIHEKDLNLEKPLKSFYDEQSGVNSQENQQKFQEVFNTKPSTVTDVEGVYKEGDEISEITKESQNKVLGKESLLSSLALIKKGEGVTNPLMRQIEEMLKNPEQAKELGFDGKDAHKFAIKKATELAKEYGYIKPDGSEVRLGTNAIGHTAYEVKMIDGKLTVNETFNGKDMAEGTIDKEYEYSYKKEVKVPTLREDLVTPEVHVSETDPMSKFSRLYIKNLRNQPLYEQLQNEKVSDILKNPLAAEEFKLIKSMEEQIKQSTGIDINPKTNETLKTYLDRLTSELNTNEKALNTTKGVLPDFKFLQDKNNTEWIEAGKPTVDGETKLAQDIIKDKNNHLGQELKKYHDYVKAETGKDIEVKSDDTPETYKKALDETLQSSGKKIPTETIVGATKTEEVNIPKKELEKPLDDIKSENKVINPNELIGNEKLIELDKLQEKTLEHFNENIKSFQESSRIEDYELKKLLTPSDKNHTRIVLEGISRDENMARILVDQDYKSNSFSLKGNPNDFKITKDFSKNIHIEAKGNVFQFQETKVIKDVLYQDKKTGEYYAYKIIEIEKPHKFIPEDFTKTPEKVTPPLTSDPELKLKK